MYLAGVSVRQVDDVCRLLWGDRMPSQTLSDKLKKVYADIDEWRNRQRDYPCVFMDGVWRKRCRGGSVENAGVLVAIGVGMDGRRGARGGGGHEGGRGKLARVHHRHHCAWFEGRRAGGGRSVRGTCGRGERTAAEGALPAVQGAFRTRHTRQGRSQEPGLGGRRVEAVFSMETRDRALEKAESVAGEMESRRLGEAARCLREGIGETTAYLLDDYPGHRRRIRTNNMIERLNREIRRRTRVVGSFPDGRGALMLACARVRYVTSSEWSTRRYLDMSRLGETVREAN